MLKEHGISVLLTVLRALSDKERNTRILASQDVGSNNHIAETLKVKDCQPSKTAGAQITTGRNLPGDQVLSNTNESNVVTEKQTIFFFADDSVTTAQSRKGTCEISMGSMHRSRKNCKLFSWRNSQFVESPNRTCTSGSRFLPPGVNFIRFCWEMYTSIPSSG